MPECPKRYDAATDTLIYVDQEWVNFVQKEFGKFGKAREEARHAITFDEKMALPETRALRDFLDAWKPEFEQKK